MFTRAEQSPLQRCAISGDGNSIPSSSMRDFSSVWFRGGTRGGLGGYSPPSEASSPLSEEILGSRWRKLGNVTHKNTIFCHLRPMLEALALLSENFWHHLDTIRKVTGRQSCIETIEKPASTVLDITQVVHYKYFEYGDMPSGRVSIFQILV